MNTVKLYNNDGTLSTQAQLLLSPKPSDMSMGEWIKLSKKFKSQVSIEEFKKFVKLKRNIRTKAYYRKNKENVKACNKTYYQKNKEKVKACNKTYREKNKEEIRGCQEKNKEEIRAYQKAYYQKNKENVKACNKTYREKNKEKRKAYREKNKEKRKAYREKNKEKGRTYYKTYYYKNKEKANALDKIYYQKNKEKSKARRKKYARTRRQKDPLFKFFCNIRSQARRVVKQVGLGKKPTNTFEWVGCTPEELKAHFESLFQEGMSWDNYGKRGWHVDHIRPVSSFKPEEWEQINHYANLQPLWWQDNLKKGDKY